MALACNTMHISSHNLRYLYLVEQSTNKYIEHTHQYWLCSTSSSVVSRIEKNFYHVIKQTAWHGNKRNRHTIQRSSSNKSAWNRMYPTLLCYSLAANSSLGVIVDHINCLRSLIVRCECGTGASFRFEHFI